MKRSEHGFTVIELLIVGIIVCILATLVAATYSGVQVKNRNTSRQASIDVVQSRLETYFAENSRYPSLGELNDPQWRQANLKSLSVSDIRDPKWTNSSKNCTVNSRPVFSATPVTDCYAYQTTTTDGSSCASPKVPCTQYTLTASLEGGDKYVKTSLN